MEGHSLLSSGFFQSWEGEWTRESCRSRRSTPGPSFFQVPSAWKGTEHFSSERKPRQAGLMIRVGTSRLHFKLRLHKKQTFGVSLRNRRRYVKRQSFPVELASARLGCHGSDHALEVSVPQGWWLCAARRLPQTGQHGREMGTEVLRQPPACARSWPVPTASPLCFLPK